MAVMTSLVKVVARCARLASDRRLDGLVQAVEGRAALALDLMPDALRGEVSSGLSATVDEQVAKACADRVPLMVERALLGLRPRLVGDDAQVSMHRFLLALGIAQPAWDRVAFRAMQDAYVRVSTRLPHPLRAVGYDELNGDVLFELEGLRQWWFSDGIPLWVEFDPEAARLGLLDMPACEASLRALAGKGSSYDQPRWRNGPVGPVV